MMGKALLACLIISFPFAGCTDTNPPWYLKVSGDLSEANNQYQFEGQVVLEGSPTDVTLNGVKVTYLDANQSRITEVALGEVTVSDYKINVSSNLQREPKYILLKVDEIENPTGSDYEIEGAVVQTENGEYILKINYAKYDPVY